MKKSAFILAAFLAFAMAAVDADAARRFGGGGNIGRQRAVPTQREATPQAPASTPARPAAPTAAPGTATPAPQPSFMSRWGGMLAGLGIGALLGSLFGGHLGGMGGLLLLLAALALGFMLLRGLAARRAHASAPQPSFAGDAARPRFEGIGSAIPGESRRMDDSAPAAYAQPALPPGFQVEPFLRVAKTSFIRLQAANDRKDLEDIRDYTTPEVYAEIAMQLRERGDAPQRTEVVSLDAQLADAVVEGDQEIASVRFTGLLREEPGANPEPFDEIWHVRKDRRDPQGAWLISGIQQAGATPT